MESSFVTYITFNSWSTWQMKLGFGHLKFCICYINEFVQELLDNTSIFHYDAQLGVNAITLELLLAGNK